MNAQVGYQFNKTWNANVEVFNLFDEERSDIAYFSTPRLRGEPDGGRRASRHPADDARRKSAGVQRPPLPLDMSVNKSVACRAKARNYIPLSG